METYSLIESEITSKLNDINKSIINQIERAEKSIELISNEIFKLRDRVINIGFSKQEEEIYFFRKIKPKLFAQAIYYNFVLESEINKTYYTETELQTFFNNKLSEFRKIISENIEFNHYILAKKTNLDNFYFTRNQDKITRFGNSFPLLDDPDFATNKDMVLANIIAFDLIVKHLQIESKHLPFALQWTESKTALVELIYALQSAGAINSGKAEIKEITNTLEKAFSINLGDVYRTFIELRMRKSNHTKFIDTLKDNLQNKLNEADL